MWFVSTFGMRNIPDFIWQDNKECEEGPSTELMTVWFYSGCFGGCSSWNMRYIGRVNSGNVWWKIRFWRRNIHASHVRQEGEVLVKRILNTAMSHQSKGLQVSKFVAFPCDNNTIYGEAKYLANKHNVQCRLVPRAVRSNKNSIWSRTKDAANLADIRFGLFSLACGRFGFKKLYRTFNLDLGRSVQHISLSKEWNDEAWRRASWP